MQPLYQIDDCPPSGKPLHNPQLGKLPGMPPGMPPGTPPSMPLPATEQLGIADNQTDTDGRCKKPRAQPTDETPF